MKRCVDTGPAIHVCAVNCDGSNSLSQHRQFAVVQTVIYRRQETLSESFRNSITFDLIAMLSPCLRSLCGGYMSGDSEFTCHGDSGILAVGEMSRRHKSAWCVGRRAVQ
jgi:hypothetical protein